MKQTAARPLGTVAGSTLAEQIDRALPQTQCTRCGYPDCRGYAQAIADGATGINQCPPGGAEGIARLARITGRPAEPLNPQFGEEGARHLAVIDESWCIGCTLCLDACPTDAILGRSKRMHTVVAGYCTGCELCVPVCPVDCIAMVPAGSPATGWEAWSSLQADTALQRYRRHAVRYGPQEPTGLAIGLQRTTGLAEANRTSTPVASAAQLSLEAEPAPPTASAPADSKRAMIEAALSRARALRG